MRTPAIMVGKAAAAASRMLKRGAGTTYPGVLAERLHSGLIPDLARLLPNGSVVVTGTNGKTTTSKMLGDVLAGGGVQLIRNESGSNLRQGIASALVSAASVLGGRLRGEMAVLEVDEATMRAVVPLLRPRVVCVTNLFRDQLDRYGDVDSIGARLGDAVESVSATTLLLNADDPLVVALSARHTGPAVYFGLDCTTIPAAASSSRGINSARCPNCGGLVRFSAMAYGHLGTWQCDSCGMRRPKPEFLASEVHLGIRGAAFTFTARGQSARITLPVTGLHNVYNALAAASCAVLCGAQVSLIARSLAVFRPAFGRSEELVVDGRIVELLLAKNPTGLEQAVASVLVAGATKAIGFALNDNAADGRDVSWIWDVDFDAHDLSALPLVVGGGRAEELALRLKYARNHGVMEVRENPIEAVRLLAQLTPRGGTAHMLATYTAMLEIRDAFAPTSARFSALGRELRHELQH